MVESLGSNPIHTFSFRKALFLNHWILVDDSLSTTVTLKVRNLSLIHASIDVEGAIYTISPFTGKRRGLFIKKPQSEAEWGNFHTSGVHADVREERLELIDGREYIIRRTRLRWTGKMKFRMFSNGEEVARFLYGYSHFHKCKFCITRSNTSDLPAPLLAGLGVFMAYLYWLDYTPWPV